MSAAPRITVRRQNLNYGPYSLEQVNSMLLAGRLAEDDLAWLEGAPEWQRLRTIPGVAAMPPAPPPGTGPLEPGESDRQILPAFLLAFFLGVFGLHRFYVGKTGSGIAMVVLTITVVGAIVSGIWATIDWILIVTGSFTDAEGRRLRRWT